MAIIIIDNDRKQLDVLKSALNDERWEKFKNMQGDNSLKKPDISTIEYDENLFENNLNSFVETNISDLLGKNYDTFFLLVDLFLTNQEENDDGEQKSYAEYSGYKLAMLFKEKLYEKKFNIALMSKFFKDVESTKQAELGRVILKPIYPEMKDPVLRENHTLPTSMYCSRNYNLPEKLNTRDVVQAFCNIVFEKHRSII